MRDERLGRSHSAFNAACCASFALMGALFIKSIFVPPAADGALPPMTAADVFGLVGLAVINFYGAFRCYRRSFLFWVAAVASTGAVAYAAMLAEGFFFPFVALCYVAGVLGDAASYFTVEVEYCGGDPSRGVKSLSLRRRRIVRDTPSRRLGLRELSEGVADNAGYLFLLGAPILLAAVYSLGFLDRRERLSAANLITSAALVLALGVACWIMRIVSDRALYRSLEKSLAARGVEPNCITLAEQYVIESCARRGGEFTDEEENRLINNITAKFNLLEESAVMIVDGVRRRLVNPEVAR